MIDLTKAGEAIKPTKAQQECQTLRQERETIEQKAAIVLPQALTFNQTAIASVTGVVGYAGIRIYLGLEATSSGAQQVNLMLVAVDNEGNDLLPALSDEANSIYETSGARQPVIINHGTVCPTACSRTDYMNS